MGKRLSEIEKKIKNSELLFYNYLMRTEDSLVMNAIVEVSKVTRVFIFSGVIRNFFLGERNNRDIDIVLEKEVNIPSFFQNAQITKNSFGGYKIICNNTVIDLWYLEQTWSFKNNPIPILAFDLEHRVPGTAFFNFSSIVYSFNDKSFKYEPEFVKFLRDLEIDVVNTNNPNYKLCIVNTFYYSEKYHLKIKKRLKDFVFEMYNKLDKDYSDVQQKHFGRILYSNDLIEHKVETIYYRRKNLKRKKAIF